MIHMVTRENRHLYARQLFEMHQLRRRFFIEERGWSALSTGPDGGEYDQFDDDEAIYFLGLDEEGAVTVGQRARPTADKSLLNDIFPQLIGPGVEPIDAPGVWEMTRTFAIPRYRTPRRGLRLRTELFLAMMEAACAQGVHRLVGITDVALLGQTMALGWSCRIIGLPAAYAEGDAIAVEVDSSPDGVETMRETLGAPAPRLLHILPGHPLARLDVAEAGLLAETFGALSGGQRRLATAIAARVAELQDSVDEDALVAMLDDVAAIIRRPRGGAGAAT